MARVNINGQDGTAEVTIDGDDWSCILTSQEIEQNVPQIDATTFCTEAEGDYEPGRPVTGFRLAGNLTKSALVSGPLIPLPQNVPLVLQQSEGCTFSGTGNFSRGIVRRDVGVMGVIAGEGVFRGPLVKVWDDGTP